MCVCVCVCVCMYLCVCVLVMLLSIIMDLFLSFIVVFISGFENQTLGNHPSVKSSATMKQAKHNIIEWQNEKANPVLPHDQPFKITMAGRTTTGGNVGCFSLIMFEMVRAMSATGILATAKRNISAIIPLSSCAREIWMYEPSSWRKSSWLWNKL